MAASASVALHDTATNANLVAGASDYATTEAVADLLNPSTRCDQHRTADRFHGTL